MFRKVTPIFLLVVAVFVLLSGKQSAVAGEPVDLRAAGVSSVVLFDPHLYNQPPGAPLPGVELLANVNTTNDNNAQNETSMAAHPTDANGVVGGVNDYRNAPNNDVNCGYASSSDGGATWTAGIIAGITQGTGGPFDYDAAGDPAVYYDGDGTVHYACLGFDRSFGRSALLHSSSSDGGLTWSTPVALDSSNSSNRFLDKEMLTVDTNPASLYYGRLYVSYTVFTNFFATSRIYTNYSADGGATWSGPVLVSGTQSSVQGSHPAAGPDGSVYVSWCSPCAGNARMWVNKSTDGGATWASPVQAATLTGLPSPLPGNAFRNNNFPTVAVDPLAGFVYVAYADYASGNADIRLVRSNTGGASWSAPITVNSRLQDDQFFQWMAIGPDRAVWVCYYDQSWNTMNWLDMSCSRSRNFGTSFRAAARVTTQSSDPADDGFFGAFIGDYNGMDIGSDGTPRVYWTDTRVGNAEGFSAVP